MIYLVPIYFLALLVRLAFINIFPTPLANDLFWNDAVGGNLANGNGFTASLTAPYTPSIFRTPGYPAFLALIYFFFGHSITAAFVGQAIIDSFTAVLVTLATLEMLPQRTAILAGLVYATYPYTAYFCGFLHQDILLTFATVLTFFLTVKAMNSLPSAKRWFVIGLSLGATVLVKPLFVLYGLMPALFIFRLARRWPQRLLYGTVFIIGAALFIVPWGVRNYLLFHRYPPLAVGGTGTNLQYLLIELEGGEETLVRSFKVSQEGEAGAARETYLRAFVDGVALIEQEGKLARAAWPELIRQWPQYLFLIVRHIPRLWISLYSIGRSPLIAQTGLLISVSYLLLGLIGMHLLRYQWRVLLPLYLTILLVTLIYAPYTAEARYTLPARPMLIIFVAGTISYLLARWKGKVFK